VTYLSGLNNQYIVRYYQTWVEVETNPDIIAEFEDSEDEEYYDEEEEEESEMFDLESDYKDSMLGPTPKKSKASRFKK